MLRQVLASLLLASFVLAAGGCLVTSSRDVAESGVAVSGSTLNQIVLGETTEAWLVATLGEPNDRTTVQGEADALHCFLVTALVTLKASLGRNETARKKEKRNKQDSPSHKTSIDRGPSGGKRKEAPTPRPR